MEQPDIQGRKEYAEAAYDTPSEVRIPGTKKKVKLRGLKPYTLEKLTKVWLDRDIETIPEDSASTLKSMSTEPYFAIKTALLFVLNDYWKINLFHRIMVWWWGKVLGYTEEQMSPIIEEGKKKIPLMAHWTNMVYLTDMRTDWMKMTKKEAGQYQAELLLAAKQHSLKSSHASEGQDISSSDF